MADHSRSVYSGLIHIRNGAHGARAFQTNNNLVLSEGAHADSVPNLDIEENDVRCSHASTVGPIDEDQRYYLESRGISPAVAERLIVLGFFADLAGRAPVPGVGAWVDAAVSRRLAGRLPSERRQTGRADHDRWVTRCGSAVATSIDPGHGAAIRRGELRIALVRIDDDLYAIGDTCSHEDYSLSEGEVLSRGVRDRVLEARLDLRPADGRAPDRCRPPEPCPSTPCASRATT